MAMHLNKNRLPAVRRPWTLALAAPALAVTLPLTGFAFQNEERRLFVRAAREFGSDPVAVARFSYDTAGLFLRAGNFRPLGRFAEQAERAFAVEAAEATGLSLHSVQGLVRLVLVAALAMAAVQIVSAVMRSAGTAATAQPLLALYSLALGATLVASHHLSNLTAFPVVLIGSPLLILAIALAVARDADMEPRRLAWHEHVTMAALGAAAAMTYDLVYAAPALTAAFVAVRATAARQEARLLWRMAATRRWLALTAGFLAVFVPVRVVIADLCARQQCNAYSDISLSPEIAELAVERMLTGAPPAGWAHAAGRVAPYGYRDTLPDLAGNWLIALLLAAVVILCVRAAVSVTRLSAVIGPGPKVLARLAGALGALGAFTALVPALMVSLARALQDEPREVGETWRDSLVVQIGWSFMIFAAIVAVLALAGGRERLRAAWLALATAVLCAGLVATMVSNQRFGQIGRGTPTTMLVRQMSTAVVRVDLTEDGNTRRCGLIDSYSDLYPDPGGWWGGPQVRGELDHFMLDRYGRLFCDGPGREAELLSDPPTDWDWTPRG